MTFHDLQSHDNPLNGATIQSEAQLRELFHSMHDRTPFFFELQGRDGFALTVGFAGEVGCVAILKSQRWGEGKARIEFACGNRAVKLLYEVNGVLNAAADALQCAPADLALSVARVAAESQARRKSLDALQGELAGLEAARLRAKFGAAPVVIRLERGPTFARAVAQAISAEGGTALIASTEDGRGHLCFARPKGAGPAMGALLKEALAVIAGKGGGSPDFAQGAGDNARLDDALALAAQKLSAG